MLKNFLLLSFYIFDVYNTSFIRRPSITKIKCIENFKYTNKKIIGNLKDILKINDVNIISYNDLIYENTKNNLKDILIKNNENFMFVKLNNNTVYKYYHCKKIDFIDFLKIDK